MGGLAEEERHLSILELREGTPPLRNVKEGEKEEEEDKYLAHLTCSALWEEQ